jgi:hypothetical protein
MYAKKKKLNWWKSTSITLMALMGKINFSLSMTIFKIEKKFHLTTKLLLILLLPQLNDIKIKKFASFFLILRRNFSHILIFYSFKRDEIYISIISFGTMRSLKSLITMWNLSLMKIFKALIIKKCWSWCNFFKTFRWTLLKMLFSSNILLLKK